MSTLYQANSVNRLTVAAKSVRNEGVTSWKNVVCDPPQGLECVECAQHFCPSKARSMKPQKVNNFHTDIWPLSTFTWLNSCSHTLNELSVPIEIVRWIRIDISEATSGFICTVEISQDLWIPQRRSHNAEPFGNYFPTFRKFTVTVHYEGDKILRVIGICKTTRYLSEYRYFNPPEIIIIIIINYSMEQSPSWEANWFCS